MGFKENTLNGIKWTTVSTIVRAIVSFFQVAILTRYLPKEDFGTVAIATLFIGFTSIFLDLGISVAILHKQDTTKNQYSSLYWLNIIFGILLTAILISISPLIAHYYNDNSLLKIISILSFTVFFSSIGSQHRTIQQKEKRFKFMAIVEIFSSIFTMILAVILVTNEYGIYSLIYSTLFNSIFSNILYFIYGIKTDNNISFHFNIKETYSYLKIGVFSIGTNVFNYFSREIDIAIISTTMGKDVLGAYSLCKKIVMMLYGMITPILTKVLTPLLADVQSDKSEIKRKYGQVTQLLSITNFPIYFLIAMLAPIILYYIYGQEYVSYHWVLSLLAIRYGILSVGSQIGAFETALGRTDIGFYWTIFRIISSFIFTYIGSFFSIEILALFILFEVFFNIYPGWLIELRVLIKCSIKQYIGYMIKPFLFSSIFLLLCILLDADINIWKNIALAFVFTISYLLFVKKYISKDILLLLPMPNGIINRINFFRRK